MANEPRPTLTQADVQQAVLDFHAMMTEPVVLPDGSELSVLPPEEVYREHLRAYLSERFAARVLVL